MDVSAEAAQVRRKAEDSDTLDHAVRLGLVAYGIVHVILAWLAVRLAFGDGGSSASAQGALHQLATSTVGRVSLYVVAAGFLALVLWQGYEALFGHRNDRGGKRVLKRVGSAGKAVLYAALGVTAIKTAVGSSSSGGGTDGITAQLMALPFGPLLVGLVGVVTVVVAGVLAHRGWKEKFRSDLQPKGKTGKDGSTYIVLGKVGYLSKAVAIAVVGGLFIYAAVTHDAQKSGGLDQALNKVLQQPFGAPVLTVIAIGFACYGLFCFAWAWHLDR